MIRRPLVITVKTRRRKRTLCRREPLRFWRPPSAPGLWSSHAGV